MWRADSPVSHGQDTEHSIETNPLLRHEDGFRLARLDARWPPEFHLISLRHGPYGWQAMVRVAYWFHGSPRSLVKAGAVRLFPQDAIDSACASAEERLADELAKPAPAPKARSAVSLEDLNL